MVNENELPGDAEGEHEHGHGCNINIYCGGKDKKCHCPIEFAEVYSTVPQLLAQSPGPGLPGEVLKLENSIFATANIDISNAALGTIKVLKAGWYDVTLGATGGINPIPSPLPVWSVSLFKNGLIVPGSTFANLPFSPEQHSTESLSDVFVHCDAGDNLELANTSTEQLILTSPTIGTNGVVNSATFKIKLLKAD